MILREEAMTGTISIESRSNNLIFSDFDSDSSNLPNLGRESCKWLISRELEGSDDSSGVNQA